MGGGTEKRGGDVDYGDLRMKRSKEAPTAPSNDRIMRPEQAAAKLGIKSRSPLYALVRAGRLPPPIKLSSRVVGWRESTLNEFIDACERASRGVA